MNTDTREHATFTDAAQHITCDVCESPADWLLMCSGCDEAGYLCHPHRTGFNKRMRRIDIVNCSSCGKTATTQKENWRRLINEVPL